MDQIASLTELEQLSAKVKSATDGYQTKFIKRIPLVNVPWNSSNSEERNAYYTECGLPKTVDISPALASFLAADQIKFDDKENKIPHPIIPVLRLPFSAFFALAYPPHAISTAATTVEIAHKSIIYQKEYKRIWSERHSVAGNILKMYLLTESSPGQYQLKLSEWKDVFTSVTVEKEQSRVGIDTNLDISKLPQLPDNVPNKGVTRP